MVVIVLGLGLYAKKASTQARIVVEWSTASELDTVGFNLFRSQTASDPGVQVNPELIPASQDTQTGGDYRYTDNFVVSGKEYYYYLEDVSMGGSIQRHGPVIVKAESSGKIVWFLTFFFTAVTLFGFITLIWPRRQTR